MPRRHQHRSSRRLNRRLKPVASGSRSRASGVRFARLVTIMQRLRSRTGCPWDKEQTLESLKPFVLEETYEVLDAIDRRDYDALKYEIGDLLFEAVFLAQICAEAGRFTVADAIKAITEKLVRRHPHVFGEGVTRKHLASSGAVREQWERLKAKESGPERQGVLAGVPPTLPALLRAYEIGSRVAAVGFDWATPADVIAKIDEEIGELRHAMKRETRTRVAEEMGDLLFALVNLSRKLGIEPEAALRSANDKFSRRFAGVEARLARRGRSVHVATREELERAWQEVKGVRARRSRKTR